MSHHVTEDERAHYFLKDSLGRDPTPEEVRRFIATFTWIEIPIRRDRVRA